MTLKSHTDKIPRTGRFCAAFLAGIWKLLGLFCSAHRWSGAGSLDAKNYGAEGRDRIGLGGAVASWDSLSGGPKSWLESKPAPLPEAGLGKAGFQEGMASLPHWLSVGAWFHVSVKGCSCCPVTVELAFTP